VIVPQRKKAIITALFVGTLLGVINHGDILLSGVFPEIFLPFGSAGSIPASRTTFYSLLYSPEIGLKKRQKTAGYSQHAKHLNCSRIF